MSAAILPISVLILTRNEQRDIGGCLASVTWSDDVQVLDSLSTDATAAIAQAAGARVTLRAFDGYSSQRNFGLHALEWRHDWLLILDADERVPPELLPVLLRFVRDAAPDTAAARIRRRDFWWGRWLKHAQLSPFFIRLVRPARVRYEREINEVLVADGPIAELPGFFDHFPFSKGLEHWIARHNAYSRMEAEVIAAGQGTDGSWRTALLGRDFNERRRHQKALFYRMPGRPFIKLVYSLVVRRAFLDGWPGVRYAVLQSIYEYFIVLKTRELREQAAESRQISPQKVAS